MKLNDISIVNTAFFREMLQVKDNNYQQAQRYIQPDKRIENQWKKPSARIKVTASSTVLLIPCHLEGANHWVLTVRIKMMNGSCKFFIFDSQGAKAAGKRRKMITDPLKAIGLFCTNDTCSIMKTEAQTEWECGARVAQYMINFTEWIGQNNDGEIILNRMIRGINYERKKQCDLAAESRKTLRNILGNEKLLHGV